MKPSDPQREKLFQIFQISTFPWQVRRCRGLPDKLLAKALLKDSCFSKLNLTWPGTFPLGCPGTDADIWSKLANGQNYVIMWEES
jgi:hypothetical protein